jgi:DNA polymerase
LIGEQPGNEEDLAGKPFVGPAGRMLDKALAQAGIPRDSVYVTNAVKHFSYIWRGKRRLHSKPSLRVVRACRPWLEAELGAVAPHVVTCLGATAAQSLMGAKFGILQNRGRAFETTWGTLTVTYHPSALLRMEDKPRAEAFDALVADLKFAYQLATRPKQSSG